MKSSYYTYVLVDSRNGAPFYVGKGKKYRMYDVRVNQPKLYNKIQKIRSLGLRIIYEKWFESDDEDFCYFAEIYLIDFLRSEGFKLCNMTDGGEGIKHTEETKAKIAAANRRRKLSPGTRAKISTSTLGRIPWNKGKKRPPFSEEWKNKIRQSMLKKGKH